MRVTLIAIIVGALAAIRKTLENRMTELEIRGGIKTVQKRSAYKCLDHIFQRYTMMG